MKIRLKTNHRETSRERNNEFCYYAERPASPLTSKVQFFLRSKEELIEDSTYLLNVSVYDISSDVILADVVDVIETIEVSPHLSKPRKKLFSQFR